MQAIPPEVWAQMWADTGRLGPEICLTVAACAVLLTPFLPAGKTRAWPHMTAAGLGIVAAAVATVWSLGPVQGEVFFGSLAVDPFSQFYKLLLCGFAALVLVQWWLMDRGDSDPRDTPDFLCLILGSAVGLSLMASANHLLTIVLAIELASLPSYALGGWRKTSRLGSEASLKYVIFGAVCTGISVYGMSLLYAQAGTLSLTGVADAMVAQGLNPMMSVALLAALAGVAFKLAAVPVHFWCPDVFQAAPVSVATWLSVASKSAAVVLMSRFVYAFAFSGEAVDHTPLLIGVGVLGALTATWGNLMALRQDHFRRLLAFSSMAQAGYIVMVVASLAVAGPAEELSANTVARAILFYLLVYGITKIGAFTAAEMLARTRDSHELPRWRGLGWSSWLTCGLLLVFTLSLTGLPPLGGFLGKLLLMTAMAEPMRWFLVAVLMINTVLSLYYYVGRPVQILYTQPAPDHEPVQGVVFPPPQRFALSVIVAACAVVVLGTGLGLGLQAASDYASLSVPTGP